ncbi:unnamed protein product [Amoebophrya sp. A25]|nr:unnamed protein product [Amoebophrya sp. A25]|eukprot:GSA25T00011808001.1
MSDRTRRLIVLGTAFGRLITTFEKGIDGSLLLSLCNPV